MSKVLYLDEVRSHTLSAGPKHLMRLVPGRNVIEDEVFDAVLNAVSKDTKGKETPNRLQEMMDKGTIRVVGESVDITKMKAVDAMELIELEATEDGLTDLLEQESSKPKPRKTIVEAIEGKLESIEKAGKEPVTTED